MCGVFGIRAPERDVARVTFFGLFALQHRGQESAGIAVSDRGRLTVLRDMGLVAQVFDEQNLSGLQGEVAIGHTRYSTTGSTHWTNAQPIVQHGRARVVTLGHNGNLTNAQELREELAADGVALSTTSDTEVIAALIANDTAPLEEAVANAMKRLEGAYTIVALAEGKLIGFRDPHGFRPLNLGRIDGDPVLASETCALDLVGATHEREVAPGELVLIDENGIEATQAVPQAGAGALCLFEFIYLARPDSTLTGIEVHAARVKMGERLAEEAPVEADLVLPAPDSGTPAAIGFSRASGIPFSEGLIKNRYVGPRSSSPTRACASRASASSSTRSRRWPASASSSSTTRSSAAARCGRSSRSSSTRAPRRCMSESLAADRLAVLLRDRLRRRGATRRLVAHRGGGAGADRCDVARVHLARGRPGGDDAARNEFCRACFTRTYPTRVPAGKTLAKFRFEPSTA